MLNMIFICGPALLCVSYYSKIRNIPLKSLSFLQWYGIFLFIINGFVVTVIYLRGFGDVVLQPLHSFKSTAKYWLLSFAVALALPHFLVWLDKLVNLLKQRINQLKMEDEDNEKPIM